MAGFADLAFKAAAGFSTTSCKAIVKGLHGRPSFSATGLSQQRGGEAHAALPDKREQAVGCGCREKLIPSSIKTKVQVRLRFQEPSLTWPRISIEASKAPIASIADVGDLSVTRAGAGCILRLRRMFATILVIVASIIYLANVESMSTSDELQLALMNSLS